MLKQGYKQTEIGVIPEDWEVIRLGDFIKLKNGYAFPSENFSDKGPIVMTPGNFKLEGGLKFSSDKTIRYKGSYSKEMQFSNGDLVMVMTDLTPDCNLLGKSGIIDTSEVVLHNQRIGKIICSELINPKYLSFYFNSEAFSFRMKSTATGSTVRHTSTPTIKNTVLTLPPLAEQEAIASALSDADAWIESLEQLIAKKRLIKQVAMQTLLTPPSHTEALEAWEVKKLGEVLKSVGSGTSNTLSDGQFFPIYGSTGIIGFKNYFDYEGHNITVARVGANAGRVNLISGKYCVSDNTLLLIPNNEIHVKFLFYFLIKANLNSLVFGSGQPLITGGQLKVLELPLPSLSEQERIATILSDMDAELEALETQLGKARQIKQGMMQELLTGRTRLV